LADAQAVFKNTTNAVGAAYENTTNAVGAAMYSTAVVVNPIADRAVAQGQAAYQATTDALGTAIYNGAVGTKAVTDWATKKGQVAFDTTTDLTGAGLYYGSKYASDFAQDMILQKRLEGGMLLAIVTGDVFDSALSAALFKPASSFGPGRDLLLVINGIANMDTDAKDMLNAIVKKVGIDPRNATRIQNGTHGIIGSLIPILGDIVQVVGNEFGMLDLPIQRTAAQIHEMYKALAGRKGPCPRIHVVAHSQGTEVFYGALSLLSKEEKAMIHFHGFGSEHIITKSEGLAFAENIRNPGDGVPIIGNDINPLRHPGDFMSNSDSLYSFTDLLYKSHSDENVVYYDNLAIGTEGLKHSFGTFYLDYITPDLLNH